MNKYFPRISRRITEPLGFLFLVILFFLVAFTLKNLNDYKTAKTEKARIQEEIIFWQNVVSEKPDYRDAYLQLSILEYRIGNTDQAQLHLEKALILDPNFEKGKEFEKELNK